MGHFPKPESTRIPLSDGEFIDVKKRLTHGEREDMFARISPNAFKVERREVRTAKVVAYLVGWSLTDGERPGEGQPVPMSPDLPESTRIDTIRSLDPDTFLEIHDAIDAHEDRMAEERAEAKKKRTGMPSSDPISPSRFAVVGASTKSDL